MVNEYQKAHRNIRKIRGDASNFDCIENCGNKASDWAHIHNTEPYILDNYEPRCRQCHIKYDYTDDRKIKIGASLYTGVHTERIIINDSEPLSRPGERNGNALLTEKDVIEIRRLYATGNYTQKQIAKIYSMSESGMRSVIKRENWKHIP